MSVAELKEALGSLGPEELADVHEHLRALQEGVPVAELRAMDAAIQEALDEPGKDLTLDEVRESLRNMKFGDVP